MSLGEEVLLTAELSREQFVPLAGSVYVHALSLEDRSLLDKSWKERAVANEVVFAEVTELNDDIMVDCVSRGLNGDVANLRDNAALREVVLRLRGPIYLDLTGMTHRVWAALLRAFIDARCNLRVVYVEPADYTRSTAPAPGLIFSLSERIEGISPLPGFAYLRRMPNPEDSCFVPLLGFEGARLGYVLEHVQPLDNKTVPIIGVPGFRPEYPFHSYTGNRIQLERNYLASQVRYAKANCPFDAFMALHRVADDYPGDLLRVAPIGTKPHGVGAVLFALSRPSGVELIYDHPVRKGRRTTGEARVCVYDVGSFVTSDLFLRLGEYAGSEGTLPRVGRQR
ncbi:hypothetical protein JNW88_12020 [Micromonospora sp. ATA32]|nr:hypothetical protein [Micromonospora sp. ATA32]